MEGDLFIQSSPNEMLISLQNTVQVDTLNQPSQRLGEIALKSQLPGDGILIHTNIVSYLNNEQRALNGANG